MLKRKGIYLTENQRLHWLQLIRSENVGAVTFMSLIQQFKTAEKALSVLHELSARGGANKSIRIASKQDAEQEMELAAKMGIKFVCVGEPDYPPYLRTTDNPPPVIAVKGNLDIFQRPSVGIVGSRNASASGKKITTLFANQLGEMGFAIVSGLARGIDSTAHQASLKTGTVAVLAGGIDCIYPPENTSLYKNILDNGGAIISEMPLGWQPRAVDFPRRNRIIAGLSLGLLVAEAASRSGSLITARLAADIGRIVFAIPGSPLDPRATGPNNLIKDGALLVTHPNDIAETLTPLTPENPNKQLYLFEQADDNIFPDEPPDKPEIPLITENIEGNDSSNTDDTNDNDRKAVLAALSTTPIDIETLCFHSGVPINKIYLLLVELDLAGKLIRHAGGAVSLAIDDFPSWN